MCLKKSALVLLSIVLGAGWTASAPANPSYIGLYLDESRTTWCASGTAVYQVEMWIYAIVEGGMKQGGGVMGYSFDINFPSTVDVVSWTTNPHMIPEMCLPGYCPPGITGSYDACLVDWVWIGRVVLNVLSSDPSVIEITPNPGHGTVRLTRCVGDFHYPVVVRKVYLNYGVSAPECSVPVPTENRTWGAIKTLYQDN